MQRTIEAPFFVEIEKQADRNMRWKSDQYSAGRGNDAKIGLARRWLPVDFQEFNWIFANRLARLRELA